MLTRELLESGAYLASFRNSPDITWWTERQIADSMHATLAQRPDPAAPVWLFAYGSLIWNPAIRYAEQQQATLQDWRRSFCMRLIAGRGQARHPGRMLALDACTPQAIPENIPHWRHNMARFAERWPTRATGIAYRIEESSLHQELMLVWTREMIGGSYQPLWRDVLLADGRVVQTIVFVMNHDCPFYEHDASIATVAPIIATASGHLGHNLDYLLSLDQALRQHQIEDPYISELIDAVRVHAMDI